MAETTENAGDAPDCGLYVRIHPGYDFAATIAQLRDIFFIAKLSKYQYNMHVLELPAQALTPDIEEEIRGMVGYARQSGFVAIVRGDVTHAKAWEADGVLLEDGADIAQARTVLGADAIIGMRCGDSRECANNAFHAGVDYVTFHAQDPKTILPPDIVAWWGTLNAVPCLIEGPLNADNCAAYVQAGATFIAASDFILGSVGDGPEDNPDAIRQATADMLQAIDRALDTRVQN